MDENRIRRAAGWIYQQRDVPDWWTFPILVTAAPQHRLLRSLGLSIQEAYRVFQALEGKGFIKKMEGEVIEAEGIRLQKYEVVWAKLPEFKKYASLPILHRCLPAWAINFLEAWKTLLIGCLILIVTAFLQKFVGHFGDALYDWLFQ